MKHICKITLLLISIIFSAGNALMGQYIKTDSTRIVHRIEKYPCPMENEVFETAASPLPQYCFYSRWSAVSVLSDSSGKVRVRTDYSYYFDDSSYYVALKKTFVDKESDNKISEFMIKELQDSIRFDINLNFLSRKPKYTNDRNCNGEINIYKIAKQEEVKKYTKTGNTKVMNGFLCSEYILEDNDSRITLWVTSTNDQALNKIRNDLDNFEIYPELLYYSSGIVMLYEKYYKNSSSMQKFEVTQIDKNHFYRITSDGYVLNLGF